MKRILVIGLGMGNTYTRILKEMNHEVLTFDIDSSKNPTFSTIESLITFCEKSQGFDMVVVSTPNYLHDMYVQLMMQYCSLFLVDKPGFATSEQWKFLNDEVDIIMIKNNLYRDEFLSLGKIDRLDIIWANRNRIPNPGSWFTDKERAFGGVSRDLLPHLLSIYLSIFPNDLPIETRIKQQYTLEDIDSTDYGIVNKNGIYDVDDQCMVTFPNGKLFCSWKGTVEKDTFRMNNIELGLCPEIAYAKMFADILRFDDNVFEWNKRLDLKIHEIIEKI